ncbi:protein tipE [Agrilus planipennis]|uniref:Protein tipE n=1 Tax=Agrilus planipennis TaxID=224129 RepID=A0A1W4X2K3_AGRPL|nr:protein tipE [Agrilus planipennis]
MMRSSSSELLLDNQEELLRKQKLQELALQQASVTGASAARSCRENALFYSTSVLAVIAMSAGSSLLFLVPLYVDPAISTLASNFVPEPVTCITTRRDQLVGLVNCSWSSCREGCTSDAYHCIHIYVSYNDSGPTPKQVNDAVLLVNIKGCGYPPKVTCANFTDMYGVEGATYPCYHSLKNRTLVLTHYDKDEQVAIIIHFFAVPFVITLATSVALCVMHCDCRCHVVAHHKRVRRSRMHQDFSDGSISTGVDLHHTISHHSDLVAIRNM